MELSTERQEQIVQEEYQRIAEEEYRAKIRAELGSGTRVSAVSDLPHSERSPETARVGFGDRPKHRPLRLVCAIALVMFAFVFFIYSAMPDNAGRRLVSSSIQQDSDFPGSSAAAQAILDKAQAQSAALLQDPTGTGDPQQNCEYNAAASHPTLSQILGPRVVCAINDPSNRSYAWILYLGLVVAGLALYGALKA